MFYKRECVKLTLLKNVQVTGGWQKWESGFYSDCMSLQNHKLLSLDIAASEFICIFALHNH